MVGNKTRVSWAAWYDKFKNSIPTTILYLDLPCETCSRKQCESFYLVGGGSFIYGLVWSTVHGSIGEVKRLNQKGTARSM